MFSIRDLIVEMWNQAAANLRRTLAIAAFILVTSVSYAVLRPAEYVSSMIVAPIESSVTDATSQLLATGIGNLNLRTSFSFGMLPPKTTAFLKIMKSPEAAKSLANDPKIVAVTIDGKKNRIARIVLATKALFGIFPRPETPQNRTARMRAWLDRHVTVDQDQTFMAWTISVRHADPDAAQLILSTLQTSSEDILRRIAIQQYEMQRAYVLKSISDTSDQITKQTLYDVLFASNRALGILRSGSSVAVVVISSPFVPIAATYPPKVLSFGIALLILIAISLGALAFKSYRTLKKTSLEQGSSPAFSNIS